MAIDFIKAPAPDLQFKKSRVDFYKPEPVNLEAKYQEEKAKLDEEKAAFEVMKKDILEKEEAPKKKFFVRKPKVIKDESLGDRQ